MPAACACLVTQVLQRRRVHDAAVAEDDFGGGAVFAGHLCQHHLVQVLCAVVLQRRGRGLRFLAGAGLGPADGSSGSGWDGSAQQAGQSSKGGHRGRLALPAEEVAEESSAH